LDFGSGCEGGFGKAGYEGAREIEVLL
jgi:hypothetical protein